MCKGWSPKAQKGLREEQAGERGDGLYSPFRDSQKTLSVKAGLRGPPSHRASRIWDWNLGNGHSVSPPPEDSRTQCRVSEGTDLRAQSEELGGLG